MSAPPANPAELHALLSLLDDDTPEVRIGVAQRLADLGGDLSEWLASCSEPVSDDQRRLLSQLLRPGRRNTLRREWVSPVGGVAALGEDWEGLEAYLRLISDFLHDGVTLRQSLSDALDLLAEEAEAEGVSDARALSRHLFKESRLRGNQAGYSDPRNSDLAWSIAEGCSNPIGLCIIYILVGKRMGMEVEGVNFPGHFLCRIYEEGFGLVIDCFDRGTPHLQDSLLDRESNLDAAGRAALRRVADPGTILMRMLANLRAALEEDFRFDDAELIRELSESL